MVQTHAKPFFAKPSVVSELVAERRMFAISCPSSGRQMPYFSPQKARITFHQSPMEKSWVKNYLIGGLICLLAALVFGIKPVQRLINEAANHGTLRGAETCMDYSASVLLSPEAIRAACVQIFQKRLYGHDHATGRAGPRIDQRTVSWDGILENKTSHHVTTWIRISVIIFDPDGVKQERFAETSIWIDPLGEAEFRVELPDLEREQLDDVDFCDHDDEYPKACVTWGLTDVMGLAI